jgi:hypothetical protein
MSCYALLLQDMSVLGRSPRSSAKVLWDTLGASVMQRIHSFDSIGYATANTSYTKACLFVAIYPLITYT